MCVLQHMNFLGQRSRGIAFQQWAAGLEDDIAVVIQLIHIMNGNAAFFFAGGYHRFVHKMTVHALAAVFGQQRWVNIDDLARVGGYQAAGQFPQKTSQYNKVDATVSQVSRIRIAPEKWLFFYHQYRDARLSGDSYYAGTRLIAYHQGAFDLVAGTEVLNNPLRIGAGTGSKDGQLNHAPNLRKNNG